MANPTLENAYVIGKSNFDSWSQAFPNDTAGYLKVLPHPNLEVAFKDPFIDWQKDNQNYKNGQFSTTNAQGTYYSSWGPSKELKVTLKMSELTQTQIDGLGIIQKGNGVIEWLNNEATPYDLLRAYNSLIPGPMLITEPGDTLKITLVNDLTDPTNLHTHGLHVSAKGEGDNVLVSVKPGESREINIPIPDNHFIGLDWYHPHLHGETADQVGSGLGALLSVNAPYNLPDLDKFNPVTSPIYTFAINTLGLQEVLRSPSSTDPLNQSADANVKVPAGSPLQIFGQDSNGQNIYQLSDAPFEGYNAKPTFYNPAKPTGDPQNGTLEYGGGGLAEPVENVIHTVNGQYNPTLTVTTNQWDLFSFANMTTNAFHILQLVYDDGTQLIPQEVNLVGIDGDASGVVDVVRRQVTDFPVLNPGSRVAVQHLFDKPGTYYFISNPTEEIEDKQYVPTLIQGKKGFNDGHLIWGPQVLATVKVTGNPVDPNTNPQAPFPQAYDILTQQSKKIDDLINGPVDRERQFTWDANVGGALQVLGPNGGFPKDTDVSTFQGTYTINGRYFSSSEPANIPPLAMPMLGTTEIWNVINRSGLPSASLPQATPPNIPLSEWHPFHIHQNDFTVLSINGIDVKDINDNYLSGVLSDTIALPPAYIKGTATKDNPYGQPFIYNPGNPGDVANAQASEVKILMHFEDFPGSYVNHCHILFHEDAGMMMVLRPILNTKETWLGLSSDDTSGQIDLSRANNPSAAGISLTPYGTAFNKGVDVAIADVNYKSKDGENKNVTDNVTDVITIQKSLDKPTDKFKVKVFDGAILIQKQESQTKIDGLDPSPLLTEINPFQNIAPSTNQIASVASGDIDGDGFSDIVVGLGGGITPIIEIYSGKDYQLKARLAPFHHENFTGKINLAVGDVNGDNYDDIIVGEGSGGRGLVELYDGRKLHETATLSETPKDTAHHTALLSQDFQPYGTSYTGEVDVTSGYILQRPDVPNDATTQTNNANITTIAKGPVPQGQEQIQVYTFLGGDHVHDSSTTTDPMAEQLRKEVSLTPTGNTQEISGTFADLPGLPKGEPVLFTKKQNGDYEIIHLGDKNKPESTAIAASTTTFTLKNVNKDIFIINSSGGGNPKLKVKLTGRNSNLVNELGVCVVDDDKGTINGIAPGAAGYIEAALKRSQIIFSAIANNPNGFDTNNLASLLKFNSGANLKFFLVRNSTIETVLAGGASSTDVIFADASTQKITDLGTDGFSLGWKVNSSSAEFSDLVVNIQSSNDSLPLGTGLQGKPEGEQLDFRGVTQLIKAEFVVNREAAFNNYIGFYKTADETGGIDTNGDGKADILPGQAGYIQAAINQRISDINLSVSNQGTAKFTGNFQPGGIVVPFIVINEKLDALLDGNTTNDPSVYFPFLGANSDKVDHIRMLGNNIFGFEDLPQGGDKDYNDVIVKVNLSLA